MEKQKVEESGYDDYIVAFIDILGFSSLVNESVDSDSCFAKIDYALEAFNKLRLKKTWEDNNILIEVEEDAQKKHLDDYYIDKMTKCYCFSDSIIITLKANEHIEERFSALVANISKIGADLISGGILIRGAISFGKMYADSNPQSTKAFGPALIDAYLLEKDAANYPRIILSNKIIEKLKYPIRSKNERQPYHQYIERFSDGLVGFTQIKFYEVMQSAECIIEYKDLKKMLQMTKLAIISGLDKNMCNARVFAKYNWLKDQLAKLSIIDSIDQDSLERELVIPETNKHHNIHYRYSNDIYELG